MIHIQCNMHQKQPRSLRFLFFTEFWERFSYWSVQSLLILYMTQTFNFHDDYAYLLFSAFGALMMATPVLGGYIADRLLGFQRTISLGAILLSLGYYLLCFSSENMLYYGLALLVVGNGMLKPNISALLGTCYTRDDTRRQNGYTIFYFGINSGSLLGIILCGILAHSFGYTISFAVAGTALLCGLIVFIFGQKQIGTDQVRVNYKAFSVSNMRLNLRTVYLIAAVLILVYPLYWCLHHPNITNIILLCVGILLLSYLAYEVVKSEAHQRPPFIIAIVLTLFSVVFWALYMQMPMSLTLFAARDVDLHFIGFYIPPSIVLAFNGGLILICTPLIIRLWNYLRAKNCEPSIPLKFAFGTFLIGMGFVALAYGATLVSPHHLAPLYTVFLGYLGLTLGELSLSPIGLAMISQYTPQRVHGLMMGAWFFALAASYVIAGQLAKIASVPTRMNKHVLFTAHIYHHAFVVYAIIGLAVGIAMMLLSPVLTKIANKKIKGST